MTNKEKETLLQALNVLRSLARKQQDKLVQHSRDLVRRSRPHLNKLATKSSDLWQTTKSKVRSVELPQKKKLTVFGLAGTAAILIGARLAATMPPENETSQSVAHTAVEKSTPQSSSSENKAAKLNAQREAAAKLKAQQEVQKALVQQRIAEAELKLKEQQAKAAEKARQAKLAALQAEQRAKIARSKVSSTRTSSKSSSGLSLLDLGITRTNRPVELGFGSSPSPSQRASYGARREMQRYQQQMAGRMGARGVR